MKKFFSVLIVISVLFSCGGTMCKPENYIYVWHCPIELDTLSKIKYWIWDNVKLESDGNVDYWQTPQETFTNRTGDCEDLALLFMYFAGKIGYETELVITEEQDNYHAVVFCDGKYYDLTWKRTWNQLKEKKQYIRTIKRMTYDDAMFCAEKYHGAGAF